MRHSVDNSHQRLFLAFAQTWWGDDGAPVFQFDVEILLNQRRHVEIGQSPWRGNTEGPEASRFDVLGEFAVAADAGGHLSADERRHGFASAGERDVVGPSRI